MSNLLVGDITYGLVGRKDRPNPPMGTQINNSSGGNKCQSKLNGKTGHLCKMWLVYGGVSREERVSSSSRNK